MYDVYVIFRSVTHGQSGKAALNRAGIPASLVRSPSKLAPNGCAYALRLRWDDWEQACGLLQGTGGTPQAVWKREPDGSFGRLA